MNNTQKSTDDILSAIKDLMEGNETVSKSNDSPLPDDVLELTKPITEDVLELTTPIEKNNEQVLKDKEEDVLELNQMVDENMKVVDLSAHVQSNILDEVDEDLIRSLVKSRLKESLENKIDVIIKEELNTLISDRISLSELSLKSKVLKN
jgi:6-pyruvoyl-tetrahydropterin synthase